MLLALIYQIVVCVLLDWHPHIEHVFLGRHIHLYKPAFDPSDRFEASLSIVEHEWLILFPQVRPILVFDWIEA